VARALAAAIAVSLLAVSGAGGAGAQTPKRGGAVVVAWEGPGIPPSCVIARFVEPACPNGFDARLIHLVLAGTLAVRAEGWSPNVASRITLTRDPFTVTLRIRPEAQWSDGTPITAADYVFSHRVYSRLFPPDRYVWAEVARVTAVDAKTVQVARSEPSSAWQFQTGVFPVSPRHVLRGEDPSEVWERAIENPKTGKPIASGPFLLQRFQPGRELVLVRNPRYWGPHPYLDRLVIRFGLNSADALLRGEVDVVGGSGGNDLAAAVEFVDRPQPGIRLIDGPGDAWEHIDLRIGSGGHPALRSKLVRRALVYGIDREAIVRELFSKSAPSVRVLHSTAFFSTERGYRPNWARYRSRPREARRLLAQAGCQRGADGIYACAGKRLSLRFVTTAGNHVRERTLELVQEQLRRIGVEVVPSYVAPAALGPFLDLGDFDAALFALRKDSPGETGSWPYSCAEPERTANRTGYCSRLFNADFDQLRRIVHPARYATVANRADRRLALDVPVIPLYVAPRLYAYRESIRGIRPTAFSSSWWNAENWWLER